MQRLSGCNSHREAHILNESSALPACTGCKPLPHQPLGPAAKKDTSHSWLLQACERAARQPSRSCSWHVRRPPARQRPGSRTARAGAPLYTRSAACSPCVQTATPSGACTCTARRLPAAAQGPCSSAALSAAAYSPAHARQVRGCCCCYCAVPPCSPSCRPTRASACLVLPAARLSRRPQN